MEEFSFSVTKTLKGSRARTGKIITPHGEISTPAFVPVGTQATVKAVPFTELATIGVQLFFVNSYHMYLRPGAEVIKKAGGLHKFMHWDRPIITDSGGFQVFSLGAKKFTPLESDKETLVKIQDNGVTFQSHWDGNTHTFTPQSAMALQWDLGSDIHIAFDDCTPYPVSHADAEKSLARTHRWADESLEEHQRLAAVHRSSGSQYQALYGSIQGSTYEDLRVSSAKKISSMNFDGIAIGGVSVGEPKEAINRVLSYVLPHVPEDKPRHLLGVGHVDDLFTNIENGIDTFDCVEPTRIARMGEVFCMEKTGDTGSLHHDHILSLKNKKFAEDFRPIDAQCSCITCTSLSRAYVHHLFAVKELLAYYYASIHNLTFMHTLTSRIRRSIEDGTFFELKKTLL